MADALMFGHRAVQQICDLQDELVRKVGIVKTPHPERAVNPLVAFLRSEAYAQFREAKIIKGKHERSEAVSAVKNQWKEKLFPNEAVVTAEGATLAQFGAAMHELEYRSSAIWHSKELAPTDERRPTCGRFRARLAFSLASTAQPCSLAAKRSR